MLDQNTPGGWPTATTFHSANSRKMESPECSLCVLPFPCWLLSDVEHVRFEGGCLEDAFESAGLASVRTSFFGRAGDASFLCFHVEYFLRRVS